jgi:hypothetical protein
MCDKKTSRYKQSSRCHALRSGARVNRPVGCGDEGGGMFACSRGYQLHLEVQVLCSCTIDLERGGGAQHLPVLSPLSAPIEQVPACLPAYLPACSQVPAQQRPSAAARLRQPPTPTTVGTVPLRRPSRVCPPDPGLGGSSQLLPSLARPCFVATNTQQQCQQQYCCWGCCQRWWCC